MEDKYFLNENNFLGILKDRHQKLYGVLKINSPLNLTPDVLIYKNFLIEYLKGEEYGGEIKHTEGIFKHRSGFYLYLSKIDLSELNYNVKVYYDVDQYDEVKFFIKNLSKLNSGH